MNPRCDGCSYQYDRGPGYFLGSIYINYGLTSLLIVIGYLSLFLTEVLPHEAMVWTLGTFCFLFPAFFFRHARSFWIGFDQYFDPVERMTNDAHFTEKGPNDERMTKSE